MSVPDPSTTDWVPVWTLGGAPTLADLYANRPAASAAGPGVLFFATDTLGVWRSDSAVWTLVSQGSPVITSAQMSAAPFTTPYDGQKVRLVVDDTFGIVWEFGYRAASGSAYKWEATGAVTPIIGGGGNYDPTTTWATTTAFFSVPRAGDYHGLYSAVVWSNNVPGIDISLNIGVSPSYAQAVSGGQVNFTGTNEKSTPQAGGRFTVPTAGATVAGLAQSSSTGGRLYNHRLEVRPIRIS